MAFNQLEKKDYMKTSLRAYFLQNGFNYGNYQGLGYANVLKPLFPSGQTTDSIEALLRPKELTDLMKKVSIAGQARTRLKSGTTKTARVAGGSEK